jgi:Domain of unknown function (DUF397)
MRGEIVFSVNFSSATWRKSSRSGNGSNGACVEVAFVSAAVGVRDSKNHGTHLVFDDGAWRVFTESVK